MGLKVDLSSESPALITAEGKSFRADDRHILGNFLQSSLDGQRLSDLVAAKNQGRAFELVSLSPASNFWIGSGHYLSFAEYRFALKARCNLLPVKTVVATLHIPPNIQPPTGGKDKKDQHLPRNPRRIFQITEVLTIGSSIHRQHPDYKNGTAAIKRGVFVTSWRTILQNVKSLLKTWKNTSQQSPLNFSLRMCLFNNKLP